MPLALLAAGKYGGKAVRRDGECRVLRAVVGFFGQTEGQPSEAVGDDLLVIFVVDVPDRERALREQLALAGEVFLKALVLARPDVVGRKVGEYAEIEAQIGRAVQLHALRGRLDQHIFAAAQPHLSQMAEDFIAFGRGVRRFQHLAVVHHAQRADVADLAAGGFQNRAQDRAGARLSLRPRDGDELRRDEFFLLLRRELEQAARHHRERAPRVGHQIGDGVVGKRHSVLDDKIPAAVFVGVHTTVMPVAVGAAHCHEDRVRPRLAGVVDDVRDFFSAVQKGGDKRVIRKQLQNVHTLSRSFPPASALRSESKKACAARSSAVPSNTISDGPVIKRLSAALSHSM